MSSRSSSLAIVSTHSQSNRLRWNAWGVHIHIPSPSTVMSQRAETCRWEQTICLLVPNHQGLQTRKLPPRQDTRKAIQRKKASQKQKEKDKDESDRAQSATNWQAKKASIDTNKSGLSESNTRTLNSEKAGWNLNIFLLSKRDMVQNPHHKSQSFCL